MTKKKRKKRRAKLRLTLLAAVIVIALGILSAAMYARYHISYYDKTDPVARVRFFGGGELVVELFPKQAPNTVACFIDLAENGFYDGKTLRFDESGGLFQLDGAADYAIGGEFEQNGFVNPLSHTRGTLSMARKTRFDSASGSFFVMLGDLPALDGSYAAFGIALKGLEALDTARQSGEIRIESVHVDTKNTEYSVIKQEDFK